MKSVEKDGTYVYCILSAGGAKTIEEPLTGIEGHGVDTISFRDIAAFVSRHHSSMIYRASRDNVLTHEKVVESAMREHAVLPVRFSTIAASEEDIGIILEKEYDRFRDLLDRFEGKVELGLKAVFQENTIYDDILEKYEKIRVSKERIAGLPSKKAYRLQVEVGKMVESALQEEKGICKDNILSKLSPLALELKSNETYGELMILNTSFLVEKRREAEFDQAVGALDSKHSRKIRFKYVGTLPPYNFVNLTIHFVKGKMHVSC